MSFTTRQLKILSMAAAISACALAIPARADMTGGAGAAKAAATSIAQGKWAVMAGSNLRSTLEGWAGASGWTVVWDSPADYRIRASATFEGGFEEAVGRLVDSIYQVNPELSVTLYRGNRVVHVQHMPTATN